MGFYDNFSQPCVKTALPKTAELFCYAFASFFKICIVSLTVETGMISISLKLFKPFIFPFGSIQR